MSQSGPGGGNWTGLEDVKLTLEERPFDVLRPAAVVLNEDAQLGERADLVVLELLGHRLNCGYRDPRIGLVFMYRLAGADRSQR